jgi:hypothetical protein
MIMVMNKYVKLALQALSYIITLILGGVGTEVLL